MALTNPPSAFAALQELLRGLLERLRPHDGRVSKQELTRCVSELTTRVNGALREYHALETHAEKLAASPTLTYAQDLISHACRLLRFEARHLTPQNQIVADLLTTLENRERLLREKYRARAERELAIVHDERVKTMLAASLHAFMVRLERGRGSTRGTTPGESERNV